MASAKVIAHGEIVTIETQRLLLRPARPTDAESLHPVFADPETMRFWSEKPHVDLARTQAWMAGMTESSQNGKTDFILCLKPDPSANASSSASEAIAIGKAGVYSGRPSNEIGFLVARPHWRKGLARETLTALLDYLFTLERPAERSPDGDSTQESGAGDQDAPCYTKLEAAELDSPWAYPSITADADPRNAASVGILEHMGFVKSGFAEKSYHIGDEWQDSQYLRLTRDEWLRKRAVA